MLRDCDGGPSISEGGATPIGGRSVFVNVLCGCCGRFAGIGFVVAPGDGAVFARFCAADEACGFTAAIAAGVALRAPGGSGGGALLFFIAGACEAFAGSGGGVVFSFAGGVAFAVGAAEITASEPSLMTGASTFVSELGAVGITGCVFDASGT